MQATHPTSHPFHSCDGSHSLQQRDAEDKAASPTMTQSASCCGSTEPCLAGIPTHQWLTGFCCEDPLLIDSLIGSKLINNNFDILVTNSVINQAEVH